MSLTKELCAGTHKIRYELAEHETIEFTITVVAGQPKTYHKTLTKQEPDFSITTIQLSPQEGNIGDSITAYMKIKNSGNISAVADVWGFLDSTPLPKLKTTTISIGSTITFNYAFTVPNIATGSKELTISVGRMGISVDDTKKIPFTIKAKTVPITFSSAPTGVSVYIDGVLIGKT